MNEQTPAPKAAEAPRKPADSEAKGKPAVPPAKPAEKPAAKPAEKPAAVKAPGTPVAKPAAPAPKPAPKPPAPAPAPAPAPKPQPASLPPVSRSRVRRRHWGVLVSLILLVLAPVALSAAYLYTRAADQYASTVAFSVRSEDTGAAIELFGGVADLAGSSSSSSDTDILYEFIQSQKLVAEIDARLDLRAIWSRPENDPVFAYDAPGTIEDLLDHWGRMVRINYDSGTGLMEIRTLAFSPEEATLIAAAIFEESSTMINQLSDIARQDTIRYAKEELAGAVERLRKARQELTRFRNLHQIVDPTVDLQSQAGLMGSLQEQLATTLIDLDLVRSTARNSDPRIAQLEARVAVIEDRISAERRKLGLGEGAGQGEVLATLVGQYEGLVVDREFAEQTYTAALAAYDAALAEARRQSRYLAAHVLPTSAEKSEYPQRELLLFLVALFLFLGWSILTLVYYAIRDRR